MHEDDDYDSGLGEDDDAGEYEELLNEKLQQARVLIDKKETVDPRDLLNDVLNHGDTEQEVAAAAMIEEIDIIIAAAEEAAAAEGELARQDQGDNEGDAV